MNTTIPTPDDGRFDSQGALKGPERGEFGSDKGLHDVHRKAGAYVTEGFGGLGGRQELLEIGWTFGVASDGGHRYKITERFGSGGMAFVYLVEDRESEKSQALVLKVAIHQPRTGEQRDAMLSAFRREIEVCKQVRSSHVACVFGDLYDTFSVPAPEGGRKKAIVHAYMMRLYEFGDLRKHLKESLATMPDAEFVPHALKLVADACDGVADMHEQGYVHGDVKPENVLVNANGAYVSDFGLSMHTQDVSGEPTGNIRGTPGYLSPELIRETRDAMEPDDVYALGCVAYDVFSRLTEVPVEIATDPYQTLANVRQSKKSNGLHGKSASLFGTSARAMATRMTGPEKGRPTAREAADFFRELALDVRGNIKQIKRVTNFGGQLASPVTLSGKVSVTTAKTLRENGALFESPEGDLVHIRKAEEKAAAPAQKAAPKAKGVKAYVVGLVNALLGRSE